MMATVLFIITIPIEAEENRLMQEFLNKKGDVRFDLKDNAISSTTNASITKSSENNTITSRATHSTDSGTLTKTSLKVGGLARNLPLEKSGIESDTDGISGKIVVDNDSTGNNTERLSHKNFAKRRLTDATIKSVDDYRENMGHPPSLADSLKDIDFMDNAKNWPDPHDAVSNSFTKHKLSKQKSVSSELSQTACMEHVVRKLLKKFQIQNAIWTQDNRGLMYQIFFPLAFDETYEKLLHDLNKWGIGDREGSTVSVMNCVNCKTFTSTCDDNENDDCNTDNLAQKQGTWDRFMNSVRSRLNVAQIVRDVRQNAAITFDFVVLLVSAAILASFGLVEDSTIFLASSMLISPLMGPIIAVIFGTVIKDSSLGKLGIKNELFGILVAILVGFTFGLIICTTDKRYETGEGLTTEMLSRCELHSLLVGLFTAVASGAAAAIGILGGNIGSLVGVAISASLLPPAVNSGVLWSLALLYKIYENDETRYNNIVKNTIYSSNQATELAILGTISMCLTISNIFCIYIMGILVLKIKEIAPVISSDNKQFWKHDIKIARDLKTSDIDADIAIMDEIGNFPDNDQAVLGINYNILRKIQSMDESCYQNTWSPNTIHRLYDSQGEPMNQNYCTIHPIERLYSTITNNKSAKEKKYRFNLSRLSGNRLPDLSTYCKLLGDNGGTSSSLPPIYDPSLSVTTTARSTNSDASKFASNSLTSRHIEEHKRRKFIVTPADDPLHSVRSSDDIDV